MGSGKKDLLFLFNQPDNHDMSPIDKRERLSRVFSATRLIHLLEMLPQRRVLIVLTYHRIGDPHSTPYDSGVFSATGAE